MRVGGEEVKGAEAKPSRSGVRGLWSATAAAAFLIVNVAIGLDRPLAESAPPGYRYWEDFRVAVHLYRGGRPADSSAAAHATDFEAAEAESARLTIRPWQFWRTAEEGAFPRARAATDIRPLEDIGRARLVALFFRLRGGIAPFAPFWPAALLAIPLLAWTGWEMSRAGLSLAAAVFLFAVAASAFVVDVLPLAYSPAGFYVVALLMIVPWSVYLLGGPTTSRGLLARAAAGGAALAVCALCRGGTILVLPGFVAAALLAGVGPRPRPRAVLLLAVVILAVPPVVARAMAGGHDFWIGIWEGFGDFDRSKGHVWSDAVAKRAARARGVEDLRSPESQRFFRGDVTETILSDPAWYAAILARRLAATLLQTKLWGPGFRPSTHPNEGAMDGYYGLTRHADVFTAFGRAAEVPVPFLLCGPVLLVLACVRRRRRGGVPRVAWCVACLGAGALALPIGISTAGALETEAVALVWLLAWALGAEWVAEAGRRPFPPWPSSPS